MTTYGQYCPISRASEIVAERWTPIIVRNLLKGATTFNAIADGAPGISRTLLTQRLRTLERAGVLRSEPKPSGRGRSYGLTAAGRDLAGVLDALGAWGARWLVLTEDDANPEFTLWAWCHDSLAVEQLPADRTVVRFDFAEQEPARRRYWVLFDRPTAEVCDRDPGYDVDLVVEATALDLARWHLGHRDWAASLRSGAIRTTGPRELARRLPTWNRRSRFATVTPRRSPIPASA